MPLNWETVHFRTHANIKNIIGKELINDDTVAIMELVKNSYDAGASRVDVIFKNIFNDKERNIETLTDVSSQTSQIIIQDNGCGMSKSDVVNKWLNLAYSSKRAEHTQNNRYQAGNKGVGRFSCDRLGAFINLYTRQENKSFIHLQISWSDFESIDDINTQIQDIPIRVRELSEENFKSETGFNTFDKGTLLQVLKLNSVWAELEDYGLFPKVDKTKLLKLKNSLEKLINPNQSFDEHTFNIHLQAKDLQEESNIEYHESVNGRISNQIFNKLDFKTTFIQSVITKDGSQIITELKDKSRVIFRLIEKNTEFNLLKDIKIVLYYLNPYAKAYFKRQTGIHSVAFGSIFLFMNGFRIPPYGDSGNDSFGLEVRKNQGRSRYFSNREILGRIEVNDYNNQFRVISSREGIVQNNVYKQLISDFEQKSSKYNGFFYKTLKRIEKYVVDGISWDSLPEGIDERSLEKTIEKSDWNESQEQFSIDNKTRLNQTSSAIHSILSLRNKDVIDLYINEDLIESLIEEDNEKTNEKLQKFLKNYNNLSSDALDSKTKQAISKLAKNVKASETIPSELSDQLEQVIKSKKHVDQELIEQKKTQKELYKLFRNKIRENRKKAKSKEKDLSVKLNETTEELKAEKKKSLFQKSLITTEKEQIIGLQHQINHSTSRINRNLQLLIDTLSVNNLTTKQKKHLRIMSSEAEKISAISNYITKANFNLTATDISEDIISYIKEYIEELYLSNTKIIDSELKQIKVLTNDLEFKRKFKPLEVSILIDNFIHNAQKANAQNLTFDFEIISDQLSIKIIDDGSGIKEQNLAKVFDLGFTTTDGSGIGLFNAKETARELNGSLNILESSSNGTTFNLKVSK